MTGSRTDISVTNRPDGHEYYLVLRARVSVSQHATRESGAHVDIYDVRATALVPPVEVPAGDTQIVIPLGPITKGEAGDVCERVAASGLLQAAFQAHTDRGCTNAKVIGQDAVSAIRTLAASRTSAPAEVRHSTGRPSIGPKIQVRIPEEQLDELTRRAELAGIDRTELIRRYVTAGLTQEPEGLGPEQRTEILAYAQLLASHGAVRREDVIADVLTKMVSEDHGSRPGRGQIEDYAAQLASWVLANTETLPRWSASPRYRLADVVVPLGPYSDLDQELVDAAMQAAQWVARWSSERWPSDTLRP